MQRLFAMLMLSGALAAGGAIAQEQKRQEPNERD